MIFHQPVADHLGLLGVANHHRDDVAGVFDLRNAGGTQRGAHLGDPLLLALALERAGLQMADAGEGAGGNRRWQRRGEDEARGKAADKVAHRL